MNLGCLSALETMDDFLVSAATDIIQCWNSNGVCETSIKTNSSVTSMQVFDGRLYLSTTNHGVFILDDKESREKRWQLTKLLLISKIKNSWASDCYISSLPIELIHIIVRIALKLNRS